MGRNRWSKSWLKALASGNRLTRRMTGNKREDFKRKTLFIYKEEKGKGKRNGFIRN